MCVICSCMRRKPKLHTFNENIKKTINKTSTAASVKTNEMLLASKIANNEFLVINDATQKLSPKVLDIELLNNQFLLTKPNFKVKKKYFL